MKAKSACTKNHNPIGVLEALTKKHHLILFSTKETPEKQDLFIQNCQSALSTTPLAKPHLVLPTSGSTGEAKGVLLSFEALLESAKQVNHALNIHSKSRLLLSLPLYHAGGLGILMRAHVAGCDFFEAKPTLEEALLAHKPTHISLVPTQLISLLKNPNCLLALRHCEAIVLGGALVPKALIEQGQNLGLNLYTSYGLSEAASTVALSGQILPHHQVFIENGEVVLQSPFLFTGYIKQKTIQFQSSLFYTSDMGYLDANQKLIIEGRKDFRINSGGEKVYPEEIEQAFFYLKEIQAVCVVGFQHPLFGQRPAAFISTKKPFKEAHIKQALLPYLAKWKIPDYILPWPKGQEGLKPSRDIFQKAIQQHLI